MTRPNHPNRASSWRDACRTPSWWYWRIRRIRPNGMNHRSSNAWRCLSCSPAASLRGAAGKRSEHHYLGSGLSTAPDGLVNQNLADTARSLCSTRSRREFVSHMSLSVLRRQTSVRFHVLANTSGSVTNDTCRTSEICNAAGIALSSRVLALRPSVCSRSRLPSQQDAGHRRSCGSPASGARPTHEA